jgi:hypothetical protein
MNKDQGLKIVNSSFSNSNVAILTVQNDDMAFTQFRLFRGDSNDGWKIQWHGNDAMRIQFTESFKQRFEKELFSQFSSIEEVYKIGQKKQSLIEKIRVFEQRAIRLGNAVQDSENLIHSIEIMISQINNQIERSYLDSAISPNPNVHALPELRKSLDSEKTNLANEQDRLRFLKDEKINVSNDLGNFRQELASLNN